MPFFGDRAVKEGAARRLGLEMRDYDSGNRRRIEAGRLHIVGELADGCWPVAAKAGVEQHDLAAGPDCRDRLSILSGPHCRRAPRVESYTCEACLFRRGYMLGDRHVAMRVENDLQQRRILLARTRALFIAINQRTSRLRSMQRSGSNGMKFRWRRTASRRDAARA